jgi:hypothetical protein
VYRGVVRRCTEVCRKEGERKRERGRRGAVEERDQVEEGGKETDAS